MAKGELITDTDIPRQTELIKTSRVDGWNNLRSALGTKRDKKQHTRFLVDDPFAKQELTLQYNDGLIRRIIDLLPNDMTRNWGKFESEPKKKHKEGDISYELRKMKAKDAFNKAAKWARLHGGGLIYLIATGAGAPDTELDPTKIKSIEGLKVYSLEDIQTFNCVFDYDPRSPTYGKILQYNVKSRVGNKFNIINLHHTRCFPVFGAPVPDSALATMMAIEARYWGIPILQYIFNDVRDVRGTFSSVATILQEFVVGKYKFSDLDEMLAKGGEKLLQTRISAIEESKSSINAVMIGSDEEYTRDSATVSGIPDLMDRFMMLLCAVTGYPVTRLWGRSAAGMNATGENESKDYYDDVRAAQNQLDFEIERLGQIIQAWRGITGDFPWQWNSLTQQTQEEEENSERIAAETGRTNADADQRMLQEGVLDRQDVWDMRFKEKLGPKKFQAPDVPTEADLAAAAAGALTDSNGKPEPTVPPLQKKPKNASPGKSNLSGKA